MAPFKSVGCTLLSLMKLIKKRVLGKEVLLLRLSMLGWLEQKVVHLAGPSTYVLGLCVFTRGLSCLFVPFCHFCSSCGASLFHNVV